MPIKAMMIVICVVFVGLTLFLIQGSSQSPVKRGVYAFVNKAFQVFLVMALLLLALNILVGGVIIWPFK